MWRYGNGLLAPFDLLGRGSSDGVLLQRLEADAPLPVRDGWPAWFGESRVAAHVRAMIEGVPMRLCGTHLGVLPEQRRWQRERIAERLAAEAGGDCPTIVAADFNSGIDHTHFVDEPCNMTPCCTPQQELAEWRERTGLVDVLDHLGVDDRTYPTPAPTFALDRIWVSRHFGVENAGVYVDDPVAAASDHYPVFADLVLD